MARKKVNIQIAALLFRVFTLIPKDFMLQNIFLA